MDDFHRPVMCEEIVHALLPTKEGVYLDATLGGGGHTAALLEAGAGKVIALDMDGEALAYAGRRLACFAERLSLHHANFADLGKVLKEEGTSEVEGIVFDLGLSWHQVRSQDRGFSYQGSGKLDMRFDLQAVSPTALDILRSEPRQRLERILTEYGEEPRAEKIARRIAANRKRLETTADLAALIRDTVGRGRFRKTAMRVFQALRIAVNRELANLEEGLHAACRSLAEGGRVTVIAYHSLEDRIVKNIYRNAEKEDEYRRVNKKPVYPSPEEINKNPAARSARLRILERL